MQELVQFPNMVNLTLSLGKAFDITYIKLKFQTSRPESFAIYKRTKEGGPWVPYQYYSATCRGTYGLADSNYIRRGDETRALCTSEFSDISPMNGGNIAFATMDARPTSVEDNPIMQEWATATDIRIVLNRLNTFGDEIFGDPNVLKSYYYAVSDFAVGGRCKCNGHAKECVKSTGLGQAERSVCRCEHNTAGVDCHECLPYYQDRPWAPATRDNAQECQMCNCNGLSQRCFFDRELYERTGHGGHCIDCSGNTDGPHCDLCKMDHYRRLGEKECLACQCNQIGAYKAQCNETGVCECKPGVAGDKCDHCAVNFFEFSVRGCRPCGCSVAGSRDNIPSCTPLTGQCQCKEHVEGQNCDKCKPGYFHLDEGNRFGCLSCFCNGHSSICTSSTDFTKTSITSDFARGVHGWTAVSQAGRNVTLDILPTGPNGLGIRQIGNDPVFFLAPPIYTSDQRLSYDQNLSFTLRASQEGARASIQDVIIEGRGYADEMMRIAVPIFAQGNPLPTREAQQYSFRLHEHPDYQWSPRLSALEFQKLLSNISAIRIRSTYVPDGTGYVDDISLGSAAQIGASGSAGIGQLAAHVETCQCPPGYIGQFCEDCAPGFRRAVPNGDALQVCVPCACNNHSETCDRRTGKCLCQHNTAGENCERCASGFYGRPTQGTPDDCKACPCPNNGPCAQLANGDVVCIGCATGYAGLRCDICADGYFGDPEGKHGPKIPCQACSCNGNIDPNAVGNCHPLTGACLKCTHNTTGTACESCLPGYYGDALKKTCRPCECYPPGTETVSGSVLDCDKTSGQCPCKVNVDGRRCEAAPTGFWNLVLGEGGQRCDCDPKGSFNRSCDLYSGQCHCREGVTGRKCDQCLPNHYGFGTTGCRACNCDSLGSVSLQCNLNTGQCVCQPGVVGKHCNRCQENRYNISAGCLPCAPCYNLVKDAADGYREKLKKLENALDAVANAAVTVEDLAGFKDKMDNLNTQIDELQRSAVNAIGVNGITATESANLVGRLDQIMKRVSAIEQRLHNTSSLIESGRMFANDAGFVSHEAERLLQLCFDALSNTRNYLENEAREAFMSAQDASTRFGQTSNRMSEIARDARRLADEHEHAAMAIVALADEALNSSREAMRLLTDTVAKKNNNSVVLEELRREQAHLQALQTRVQNLASMAKEDADKAYGEALEIYTRANSLTVPSINVPFLLTQAQAIDSSSQQIANSSGDLLAGNSQLIDSISSQKAQAAQMLATGKALQQDTDAMLADIDKAKVDADNAILKAENILKEARDTLQTLQQFNDVARRSEAQAKLAILDVPAVETEIAGALKRNQEAREVLYGAENDAKRAKDVALVAQKTAEDASKIAGKIREESGQAKTLASGLESKANGLAVDVENANREFEGLATQSYNEETAVRKTIEKSGEAKRKVEQAGQKVNQAMEMVDDILSQLGGMEEIEGSRLETLAIQLTDAEKQLNNADLDRRLKNLTASRQSQQKMINDYTLELERLRKEVVTLESIRDSLPEKCFNKMRLEV